MPKGSITFRIFISSTFSDLRKERNALQEKVFPRLREFCHQNGARFQAIDLRWGVSEEAGLDQQTMRICLDEIERCQKTTPRPNFLLMLGDRYGWCPLPYEICIDEFDKIIHCVNQEDRNMLTRWYRLDENAVPPNYVLQPRSGQSISIEHWGPIETALRNIFLNAISQLNLSVDEKRKYTASATEQEILKGALGLGPDSCEHVFCFERNIEDLPVDTSASDYINVLDTQAMASLASLKQEVRDKLPARNIFRYSANWIGNGITNTHIDQFCKDVYDSLYRVISQELRELKKEDPLAMEISEHKSFCDERARNFTGREVILAKVRKYVEAGDEYPLVITGDSGAGKSAFLAKLINETTPKSKGTLIYRFIGATPDSTNERSLLWGICRQIALDYNQEPSQVPMSYQELQEEFLRLASLAREDNPLILIIDALDQINGDSLKWLPTELPKNVRMILSSLETDWLTKFQEVIPIDHIIKLENLDNNFAERVLDIWLTEVRRTIKPAQRQTILQAFGKCGLPLYLKIAFEEAKKWPSYFEPPPLPEDIKGLIRNLFTRFSAPTNHGHIIVRKSMSYLAAAKNGLTEDELLDILSRDEEVLTDFLDRSKNSKNVLPERKLPVVIWSRLYFDMHPYLIERSADSASLLTFFHRQFKEVIYEEYLIDGANRIHKNLAGYFADQELRLSETGINLRKLSELPNHQILGQLWEELCETLYSLEFIETKLEAQMTFDLIADYDLALNYPSDWAGKETTRQFAHFIKKQYFILSSYPALTVQQAYNQPNGSAPQLAATCSLEKNPRPVALLKNKNEFEDRSIIVIPAHTGPVSKCKWSHDGNKIISVCNNQLKVWDAKSGEELASLEEHQARVTDCDWSPDGLIASSAEENKIIVWNSDGKKIRTFEDDKEELENSGWSCCAWSPDGSKIACGSSLGRIVIWDLKQGTNQKLLADSIFGIDKCIWKDNSTLVIIKNFKICVWDLVSGQEVLNMYSTIYAESIKSIEVNQQNRTKIYSIGEQKGIGIWDTEKGYREEIKYVISDHSSWAPNGRRVFSALSDKRLVIWDYESGRELISLGDETVKVYSSHWTLDGNKIVTGSEEGLVKVWNTESMDVEPTGEKIATNMSGQVSWSLAKFFATKLPFKSLKDDVKLGGTLRSGGIVSEILMSWLSPDWKTIVTNHTDKKLRIWDARTGVNLKTMGGHAKEVTKVAWTSDSKLMVTASRDKTLRVWLRSEGEILRKLSGHQEEISYCLWSPDNARVLSTAVNGEIKLWNGPVGFELGVYHEHKQSVNCCSWHPEGKLFCSGSDDQTIKIWDVAENFSQKTLEYHHGQVKTCEWSHDGKLIAAGGSDCRIKVWNSQGDKILVLPGHNNEIKFLRWFPDNKKLVSIDTASTIKIWDVSLAIELITWVGEANIKMFVLKGTDEIFAISREGRLYNIQVINITDSLPLVTPILHYNLRQNKFDEGLFINCAWCSASMGVIPDSLGQEITCSECHRQLRLNSFISSIPTLKPYR